MKPLKSRTCETCNKTFKRHENLVLHQNKAKPCTSIKKAFNCQHCGEPYGSISGLKYHVKQCKANIENKFNYSYNDDNIETKHLKDIIVKKDNEILKLEMELIKKENMYLKDENYHLKKNGGVTNINNGTITNISGDTQINQTIYLTAKYIKDNYESAPPLSPLENYDTIMDKNIDNSLNVTKIKKNNKNSVLHNKKIAFVETLLSIDSNGRLIMHISKMVIKLYKMDDTSLQSVWSTDSTRLTFLVKVLTEGTESVWLKDKMGKRLKIKIIDPLLTYINGLIVFYQLQCGMFINPDKNLKCLAICNIITNDVMANAIIKIIAESFSFTNVKPTIKE